MYTRQLCSAGLDVDPVHRADLHLYWFLFVSEISVAFDLFCGYINLSISHSIWHTFLQSAISIMLQAASFQYEPEEA